MEQCGKNTGAATFCSICDLRSQSVCAEMSEEEIRTISRTMAHHAVKQGQTIVKEGEENNYLYVVVSGTFRMVRHMADGRRQITGFMFPGDFVGMSNGMSDFSAEALEPGLVCTFSHGFLDEASVRHPGIRDRLFKRGLNELTKAQDHIVLLGKKTAEERVMSFLNLVRQSRRGEDRFEDRLYLAMPRQDIADYLGLRLETLSRTLASLKKDGRLKEVSGRFIELGRSFEGAVN